MRISHLAGALMTLPDDDDNPGWLTSVPLADWPELKGRLELSGQEYAAVRCRSVPRALVVSTGPLPSGERLPRHSMGVAVGGVGVEVLGCSEGWAERAANVHKYTLGIPLPVAEGG